MHDRHEVAKAYKPGDVRMKDPVISPVHRAYLLQELLIRQLVPGQPRSEARKLLPVMPYRVGIQIRNRKRFQDCCIGRGLGAIRSKDGHQSFVLYTMLALREQLNVFNGEGTVFGSINRDALNSMPIDIPPQEILDQFENIVAPMDAAIRNNYDEICRLQALRDSLLPRLMSGELDVSDLDL